RTVDRIDVSARANVNTDVLALCSRKAIKDSIIEFNEEGQKVPRSPRVARIVAGSQPSFRKVHHHVRGPGCKARPDVLLTFVDDLFLKLLARKPRHFAVERVE